MKIDFVTIHVLPDYSFLKEQYVDPYLSLLYKKDDTQHQWRFEAIEKGSLFPNGCKTTYRSYASDCIVEIRRTRTVNGLTRLGRLIGKLAKGETAVIITVTSFSSHHHDDHVLQFS